MQYSRTKNRRAEMFLSRVFVASRYSQGVFLVLLIVAIRAIMELAFSKMYKKITAPCLLGITWWSCWTCNLLKSRSVIGILQCTCRNFPWQNLARNNWYIVCYTLLSMFHWSCFWHCTVNNSMELAWVWLAKYLEEACNFFLCLKRSPKCLAQQRQNFQWIMTINRI